MPTDIFKLFKNSIEKVDVRKTPRGTLTQEPDTILITVDAIVKRRKLMTEGVSDSENFNDNITIHFKPCDKNYIAVGNYVKIDNEWRSIEEVRDGKDFNTGCTQFLYVKLANDIVKLDEEEAVWQQTSA